MAEQTANVVLTADTSQYNSEIDASVQRTEKLKQSVNGLVTTMDKIGKGVRKGLFGFAAADAVLLTGLTLSASKFEKELGTLKATLTLSQKNTDAASASLSSYRKEIQTLSATIPASRQEVTGLMTMMAKLGASSDSATKATKSVLELGHATGESATAIANNLVQLNTQMGTSMGTVSKFSDQLAVLSVKANSSVESITSFASSLAPIARTAGMTQQQLLAVSAAFNKAGAEGFAAANAYNTILSDITNSIQTGSPAISKYSNLLGVTVEQFKKMGAAEYTSKLFNEISRGGPGAINLLNQLGIEGIRAQRAIQAVASSGGIEAMLGASQNSGGAAEKGSGAATQNLFDELQKNKNRIENFTTEVGKPLADMATKFLSVFNTVAEKIDEITKPFQGFLGVVLAVSGAIATLVAGMLSLTKIMAIPAMLSFLGKSTLVGSFRAGAGSSSSLVQSYNDKQGYYQSLRNQGLSHAEANNEMRSPSGAYGPMAPMKPMGLVEKGSYQFGQMARQAGFTEGGGGNALFKGIGAGLQGFAAYNRWSAGFMDDARKDGWARGSVPGTTPGGSGMGFGAGMKDIGASFKGLFDGTKTLGEGFKDLGKSTLTLGPAFQNLGKKIGESAILNSTVSRGVAALVGSFAQLSFASLRLAASFVGAIGKFMMQQIGGSLLGMATNPIMLLMGGMMLKNKYDEDLAALKKPFDEASMAIRKYDDALGISTKKILSFSDAVDQARGNTTNNAVNVSTASTVNSSDTAIAASKPYTNDAVKNLTKDEAPSWVRRLGITDPKEMEAVKFDLIKRFGSVDAQKIIDSAVGSTNTAKDIRVQDLEKSVSFGTTVTQSARGKYNTPTTDWRSEMTPEAISKFKENSFGAVGTFSAQQTQKYGVKAGEQAGYVGFLRLLKGIKDIDPTYRTKYIEMLQDQYLGGKSIGYDSTDTEKTILKKIGNETIKKQFGDDVSATGIKEAEATLKRMQTTGRNTITDRIQNSGAIGIFATDRNIQQIGVADQGGLYGAQMALSEQAKSYANTFGKGLTGAYDELQKFKTAVGNTEDKLYKLAQAAQDVILYEQQRKQPFQTRNQNFTDVTDRFTNAAEAYKKNPNDKSVLDEFTASKTEYEKKSDEYQSFVQGIVQTTISFQKQMTRSDRDYKISMNHSERDHNKQIQRMIEDGAKSLYDPYSRMTPQRRSSANSLIGNMASQTQALTQQRHNLDILKKAGLSIKVIDALGLGTPDKAGQAASLVAEINSDPELIGQLNRAVQGQISAAGSLLKSQYNRSYRLGEEDRATQIKDTAAQRKQALADATTDLADSFKQITGSMNDMAATALTNLTKILGKQGGAIGREIKTAVKSYKNAQLEMSQTSASAIYATAGNIATGAATSLWGRGLEQGDGGPKIVKHKGDDTGLYSVAYTLAAMDKIDAVDIKKAYAFIADQSKLIGMPAAGHAVGTYTDSSGKNPLYTIFLGDGQVSFNGAAMSESDFRKQHKGYVSKGWKAFADGGIVTGPTASVIGEAGHPEAVIPLNSRGFGFMANYTNQVAREVMQLSYKSPLNRPTESMGNTSINRSTNFSGDVTVVASDPNAMARQLEQKARMSALTGGRR